MNQLVIIVPAYNEEEAIEKTLRELIIVLGSCAIILVVDDGSVDKTNKIARMCGVDVIRLLHNQGTGNAFRRGVCWAMEHDYDYAVQMDADGQHDARYVDRLMQTMVQEDADMVVGNRFFSGSKYKTPLSRLVAIRILALLQWWRTGEYIADPTSGFRLFNQKGMKFIGKFGTGRWPEAFLLSSAIENGLKVVGIDVEMRHRVVGRSKLNGISGFRCFVANAFRLLADHGKHNTRE